MVNRIEEIIFYRADNTAVTARNIGQVNTQLTQTQVRAAAASTGMTRFSGALRTATPLLATFGVGLGAAGLLQFASGAVRAGDELQKLSVRTGISARELSGWRDILARGDLNLNQFRVGVVTLQRNLADAARGVGEARDVLAELQIDPQSLLSQSSQQQILAVFGALDQLENVTERNRAAQRLMGESGAQLSTVFGTLQRDVDAAADSSNEGALRAAEFADAMEDLGDEVRTARDLLVLEGGLLPALTELAGLTTQTIQIAIDLRSNWDSLPAGAKAAILAAPGGELFTFAGRFLRERGDGSGSVYNAIAQEAFEFLQPGTAAPPGSGTRFQAATVTGDPADAVFNFGDEVAAGLGATDAQGAAIARFLATPSGGGGSGGGGGTRPRGTPPTRFTDVGGRGTRGSLQYARAQFEAFQLQERQNAVLERGLAQTRIWEQQQEQLRVSERNVRIARAEAEREAAEAAKETARLEREENARLGARFTLAGISGPLQRAALASGTDAQVAGQLALAGIERQIEGQTLTPREQAILQIERDIAFAQETLGDRKIVEALQRLLKVNEEIRDKPEPGFARVDVGGAPIFERGGSQTLAYQVQDAIDDARIRLAV